MSDERKPFDGDQPDRGETLLARWSRVKSESRETAARAPAQADAPPPAASPDAPPELPPVEDLTLDSDFTGFLHPKVDEDVRRAALRRLFSDPRFNVMDGLDVYIDDYSKTEPIPATMLASLKQAQRIFEWAAERKEAQQGETPGGAEGLARDDPAIEPPAAPEVAAQTTVPGETSAEPVKGKL